MATSARPNLLVIICDDLGYGDVSCQGGSTPTPHIDELAAGGQRLTDFHSSGVVCSPTRASLHTGVYPQRCGIDGVISAASHRDAGLSLNWQSLPGQLRKVGYRTALLGKWHLGYDPRFSPIHHGYEHFKGFVSGNVDYFSHIDQVGYLDWWQGVELQDEPGYATTLTADYAIDFMDSVAREPFFMQVAFGAPHYPYQGPSDSAERRVGDPGPTHGRRAGDPHVYGEMLASLDTEVGRMLDALDARGLTDDTLVVFTSDHGSPAGRLGSNGPFRGGKSQLFEGGHRVPTLIRWPGRIAPGESDALTFTCDLLPTLLDAANAPNPDHEIDGQSLLPFLCDGNPMPARTLFWQFKDQAAARKGPRKWIRKAGDSALPMLFNLSDDPGETRDVAAEEADIADELRDAFAVWQKSLPPKADWIA